MRSAVLLIVILVGLVTQRAGPNGTRQLVQGPAAEGRVIAEWTFEPGVADNDEREQLKRVQMVSVYDDGRVRSSRSLFAVWEGETRTIEGKLTAEQFEHFKLTLSKMTDGLAGKQIERAIGIHFPYDQFTIELPGVEHIRLRSSFRLIETNVRGPRPGVYWRVKEGYNNDKSLSRFEKLSQNYEPGEVALRETFIAVEAEFLRAAAQALINREADR